MRKKEFPKKQISKKRLKIRKRKSFWKSKTFWLSLLFVSLLFGLAYFLVFSSPLQIKEIKISGNQRIDSEKIERLINNQVEKNFFFKTKSILLTSGKAIRGLLLEEFPEIGKVKITRRLPASLVIEIEERKTFATFCQPSGNCFNADNQGIAFERTTKRQGLMVDLKEESEIVLSKKFIEPEKIQAILKIKDGLEKRLDIEVKRLLFFDERINVETGQGFEIYFTLESSIEDQIFNLEMLAKEKIKPEEVAKLEYIDLRFGNKIYYK